MGPEATAHLYQLIIRNTHAKRDQDHIPVVIYSNPQIPDRTIAIKENNYQPVISSLVSTAKELQKLSPTCLLMPCNTAHFFLQWVQPQIDTPILDMISLTAEFVKTLNHDAYDLKEKPKVGLLATDGTMNAKIYQLIFSAHHLEIVTPSDNGQTETMNIIYGGVKKSGVTPALRQRLETLISDMREKFGVYWIILGCTELPLLFAGEDLNSLGLIDPMEILAINAIQKIKNK